VEKTVALALLRERLAEVERRLEAACQRAGRARADVTLVAVTKAVSIDLAALLPELGVFDLGESRPQELWRKAAALSKSVRWHLIGHLQRNKVEATVPVVKMIQSVDSLRLLSEIDRRACQLGDRAEVLLELNVSGETSKHGFAPEDLRQSLESLHALSKTHIRGLMTMAPLQASELCRPLFGRLRQLREEWRPRLAPEHDLHHLSMGMSNDFEVAVEEGATLVRLGSILFEGFEA
jgi:PLP dependent protein